MAPFTLFFPTSETAVQRAIPDKSSGGELADILAQVRAVFEERDRSPHFQFLDEFAPDLPAALQASGFVEAWRSRMMVCTPATFRPAAPVPGVTIKMLSVDSSIADVQEGLDANAQSFESDEPPATEAQAEAFRGTLVHARAFTALLDGVPVAAGMFTDPYDGLSELSGIGALPSYRRRGIGASVTTHMVRTAFEHDIEAVFLGAANEAAGRMYERVGFHPCATLLGYNDSTPAEEKH